MTEFGYNEKPRGSIRNIPLNLLMLGGLALIIAFGTLASLYFWMKEK